MGDERKTIQIRATEELSNKFRTFTDEYPSMADGLEDLLRYAEINRAKEIYPGMADEIDNFRNRATSLIDIYIQVVENLANARDDIRIEFSRTIEGLQMELIEKRDMIDALTHENADLTDKLNTYEESINSALDRTKGLEVALDTTNNTIKIKDQLIEGHLSTISSLSAKISKLEALEDEIEPLKKQYADEKQACIIEITNLKNHVDSLINMDKDKSSFYENQLKSIRAENKEQMDNRLKEQERSLVEQYNKLIKEIKDLNNSRVNEFEINIQDLKNKIREFENKNLELLSYNKELLNNISKLESKNNELNELINSINSNNTETTNNK